MSRLQTVLDILMEVREKGLGKLGSAASAYLKLGNAAIQNAKAHGQWNKAMQAVLTTQNQVAASGKSQERIDLELLRLETQLTRVTQQRARSLREKYVAQAQVAAQEGNYAKAEQLLASAMTKTNASMAQRARLQKMMTGVGVSRAGAMDASGTRATTEALAEARLARIRGDSAREMQILTTAMERNDLSLKNRQRLLVAVAQAEARVSAEAKRHAAAIAGQPGAWNKTTAALNSFSTSFRSFIRLLGSAVLIGFTIRTVFRSLENLTVRPMYGLFTSVVNTTDEFRRMEVALSGITGSLRSAKALTSDIGRAAQGLPLSKLEAIQGIRGLAYTPATTQVLLNQNQGQREQGLRDILNILTGLATIDPEQGIKGAQYSIREALSGEFRSLRFRFELSPQVIAASIGKTLADLKADPSLVLPALKKFTETFVGPQTISEFSNLLSVQGNLFKGVVQEFFDLIGESGIYDKARNFLRNAVRAISGELHGGPGGGPTATATIAAQKISDSLSRAMDVLIAAAEQMIDSLFGVKISFNDLAKGDMQRFSDSLTKVIDGLSKFTGMLFLTVAHIADIVSDAASFFNVSLPDNDLSVLTQQRDTLQNTYASETAKRSAETLLRELTDAYKDNRVTFAEYIKREIDILRFNKLLDESKIEPFTEFAPGTGFTHYDAMKRQDEVQRQIRALGLDLRSDNQKFLGDTASLAPGAYGVRESVDLADVEKRLLRVKRDIGIIQKFMQGAGGDQGDPVAKLVNEGISGAGEIRQRASMFETAFTQQMTALGQPGDEGESHLITGEFLRLRNAMVNLNKAGDNSLKAITDGLASEAVALTAKIEELRAMPGVDEGTRLAAILDLQKQLRSLQDKPKELLDTITHGFSEQVRRLAGGLSAGLQDAPRDFRDSEWLSFMNSFQAILRTTDDLSKVTANVATQAQAQFQILQGKLPAELRGGSAGPSLLSALSMLPAGTSGNLMLQPEQVKMISQGLHQFVSDLEDMPQKFGPIKTGMDSFLTEWMDRINKMRDTLKGQIAMASLAPGLPGAGIGLPADFSMPGALEKLQELNFTFEELKQLLFDVDHAASTTAKQMQDVFGEAAQSISQSLSAGLVDTTMDAFRNMGAGVEDILANLIDAVSRAVLQAIYEITIIRTIVNPLINRAFNLLPGQGGLPTLGSAKGNAFIDGRVIPFAHGGIVDQPTFFGMSGGRMGVMGEEAPEVILPLHRAGDGSLGVAAMGGPSGRTVIVQNHFHFPNASADSFRRSRRQIAADMKRAGDRAFATS